MNRSTAGFLASLCLAIAAGAASADDDNNRPTITAIVAASGGQFDDDRQDYDILLNAVLTAGLDETLDDPAADFTVFAPDDGAFVRLARDLGYDGYDEQGAFDTIVAALTSLGGGDPIPLLTDILLYHVAAGGTSVLGVVTTGVIETLGGSIVPFGLRLLDNEPDLVDPRLVLRAVNIRASNGFIQTIDRVLIPLDLDNTDNDALPTITDIVLQSGGGFDRDRSDFDILLNAVVTAGLADALADRSAQLTVFAPDDRAFLRLARDLGYRGFAEDDVFNFIVAALTDLGGGDPIPLLTDVLLYHVSPEAAPVKSVITSDTVKTLLDGATIRPDGFFLEDNAPGLGDPRLRVPRADIRAGNGFVHPISRVLIPLPLTGSGR